jgi:hypothetical protein
VIGSAIVFGRPDAARVIGFSFQPERAAGANMEQVGLSIDWAVKVEFASTPLVTVSGSMRVPSEPELNHPLPADLHGFTRGPGAPSLR